MSIPWHEPAWRNQALTWIEGELTRLGLERRGEVEQPHAFWWSTAMRVPTSAGNLWFKAVQPEGAFEARLTPLIARRWPDRTVELLATDGERGWMLAREAGTKLRELEDGRAVEHWEALLPRYAEMQIGLASQVNELERVGVPSLRLGDLPDQLAAVLDEPEFLRGDQDGGVDQAQRDELLRALPAFSDACARLAASGVPETIQHDDLNDGNAFLRGDDHVVFDWGDACISHPFHSLVVALRSLSYRHKWEPGGPEVGRLLEVYLEAWTGFGSRHELIAAADIARQTGTIQRSMAWRRYAKVMPDDVRSVYVEAVPYGLRLYLMDGPWGTWDDGSF